MTTYWIEEKDGRILASCTAGDDDVPSAYRGGTVRQVDALYSPNNYYWNGQVVPIPEPPSANHVFQYLTGEWIDPRTAEEIIQDGRMARWEDIKRERERQFTLQAITSTGIAYRISKDEGNLLKLQEIRRAMKVPSEYVSIWMDDNNVPWSLDQPGLDLLTAEMGARGQAIYNRSWELRALIEAAESVEAIDSIDIFSGWPA